MPRLKKKSVGKVNSGSSQSKASASKKAPRKVAKAQPQKKLTKRQAAKARAAEKTGKGGVDSVDAWLKKIGTMDKFKGTTQVDFASQLSTPYHLRRPTGVPSLDIALGGGFHAGGSSEIHGAESAGKTSLAFQTAGEVQKNYGEAANILIVATEIRTDKTFARKNGFRVAYSPDEIDHYEYIRKKRGLPDFTKEEIEDLTGEVGNVVMVSGSTGEKALDVAYEALVAGLFQLVIIESLGALLTSDQEAGDVGDRTYGGSSVMITNFMNKVYPLFIIDRIEETGEGKNKVTTRSMLETTLIGINQARAEMDRSSRGPKTHAAAGAYAWKHAQLVSLELSKSQAIRGSANGPPTGREVRWKIVKGKAGTHDGKSGVYDFYHVPPDDPVFWKDVILNGSQWGIDCVSDMVSTAAGLGVVEQAGSWYTWNDEGGNLIARAQGAENMAAILVDDDEMVGLLKDLCLKAAGLPIRYR